MAKGKSSAADNGHGPTGICCFPSGPTDGGEKTQSFYVKKSCTAWVEPDVNTCTQLQELWDVFEHFDWAKPQPPNNKTYGPSALEEKKQLLRNARSDSTVIFKLLQQHFSYFKLF